MRAAKESGSLMPPMHAVNAPTKLMRELGYGEGYVYDPDTEEGFSGLNYFPDGHGAAGTSTARSSAASSARSRSGWIIGKSSAARRATPHRKNKNKPQFLASNRYAPGRLGAAGTVPVPAPYKLDYKHPGAKPHE